MQNEREGYDYVLKQVEPKVSELYRYYQGRDSTLEDKENTMEKLEILIKKKYIALSYMTDLVVIADYYNRKMYTEYNRYLKEYIIRITIFLEGY